MQPLVGGPSLSISPVSAGFRLTALRCACCHAGMEGKTAINAHLWARDPDDWYVEPEWCSAALFAREIFEGMIVDPFCGMGRILDAAAAAGHPRLGLDIRDRGAADRHSFVQADFFALRPTISFANIVTNPPYTGALEIVPRLVAMAEGQAAILLPSRWANGAKASALLERLPLARVLALSPRPSMPPGRVIMAGVKPGGGTIDFSWFVFWKGYRGKPEFGWVRRATSASGGGNERTTA